MDIGAVLPVVSVVGGVIGAVGGLVGLVERWRSRKNVKDADARAAAAEARASASEARAAEALAMMREAHQMTKEAHRMGRGRYVREALDHRKRELASSIVEQAYLSAAADSSGGGLTGIALKSEASELHRLAALSLKGDPRVADVTVDDGGVIRIWVDGSGFPAARQRAG